MLFVFMLKGDFCSGRARLEWDRRLGGHDCGWN
jgi:hypothetical protein